MGIVSKAVAAIEPGDDDQKSPNGSFHVILSAESKDRDGDTLRRDEWEDLPSWINFDVDHAMSVEKTVGSGEPTIEDDGNLHVRGTYASTQLAQDVRTLVNERHVRNTSFTFMTTKDTKDGKTTVSRELLNGAFVAIPSNRDAVVLESKALEIASKAGARNSASDQKSVQAIHDAAASLGAACTDADTQNAASGEQDGANKTLDRAAIEALIADAVKKASGSAGYEPKPYHQDPDETAVCPVCEKHNDDDARYCDQCGTELAGRDDVKIESESASDTAEAKTATTYASKALANSIEDLQNRISDALCNLYESRYSDNWVWVQATFLDGDGTSGTVVYCLNGDSMSRTFTDDGNQVTLGDQVTDVTIITTVVPEGDGKGGDAAKAATEVAVKAVTDIDWDGAASRFTIEQYRASTLVHPDEASDSKDDYKLPVKEPNGDVNSNAVHAAAGALAGARGGLTGVTAEQKEQAAKTLVGLYKHQLKQDPPDSLLELAGEKPTDDSKSADSAAADAKSAAAVSADEEFALRARAIALLNEQRALSL